MVIIHELKRNKMKPSAPNEYGSLFGFVRNRILSTPALMLALALALAVRVEFQEHIRGSISGAH